MLVQGVLTCKMLGAVLLFDKSGVFAQLMLVDGVSWSPLLPASGVLGAQGAIGVDNRGKVFDVYMGVLCHLVVLESSIAREEV